MEKYVIWLFEGFHKIMQDLSFNQRGTWSQKHRFAFYQHSSKSKRENTSLVRFFLDLSIISMILFRLCSRKLIKSKEKSCLINVWQWVFNWWNSKMSNTYFMLSVQRMDSESSIWRLRLSRRFKCIRLETYKEKKKCW